MEERNATLMLDSLKVTFRQMLNEVHPSSFEDCYRQAYTLVLHGYGDALYNAFKICLQEHVRSKTVPALNQSEGDDFFVVLRRQRLDIIWACVQIRDILMYMDRVYVQQAGRLPVKELAAQVFHQEVSQHANLSVLEDRAALHIADFLRGVGGEDVDWKSWNDSCKVLLEASDDSRQLYEEQFEVPLLRKVTEHYRVKTRKLLADKKTSDLEVLMNAFVESETLYLENVDDKTTKEWLRSALDNAVTEAKHAHV